MYWNGVAIGIVVVITHRAHQAILRDLLQGLAVCSVGAAGSSADISAVLLVAATIALAAVTAASASASLSALS